MRGDMSPDLISALDRVLALEASPDDHARLAAWVRNDADRAAWLASLRATVDADRPEVTWDVERAWQQVAARRAASAPVVAARRDASAPVIAPFRWRLGAAAAVVAVALLGVVSRGWRNQRMMPEAVTRTWIEAPIGTVRRATLADGTVVTLAAASSLTYAAQRDRREVELVGRASFEVTADSTRPFEVRTAFGTVRVLGTGFDVAAYAEEATAMVWVRHGRVAVRSAAHHAVVELSAGDLASIRAGVVTRERATDIASAGAWRDGILVFRDQPLSQVARELARWGQPLIVDPALASRRVTITLRVGALRAAAPQLALALDLQARGDSLVMREK